MGELLKGHLAAVTGAGSGIGQAIAQGFAKEGAKVIILDVNAENAAATAEAIVSDGGAAASVAVDVTDRAACKRTAQQVANEHGQLSILVNNAGINRRTPLTGETAQVERDWDDIIDVNIKGMFNITHAFVEPLRATKGRIINIGSIQSFVHVRWPNSAAYTTSKHGVMGLTKSFAAELGPDGVRVNAIGPGLVETPLNEETRRNNPDMVAMVMGHTPLGRAAKPADIVGPAVFLASDMSAYVTGGIIMVDGGFRSV